jgi:hypothetical protein
MKRSNQSGLGHVLVFVLIAVVLGVVGFAGYKVLKPAPSSFSNETVITDDAPVAEANLVLQNVGIGPDDILVTQQAVREYESRGLKGFYIFGDKLGGKDDTRINPNFEFSSVKAEAKIVSAIDGVIGFIKEQPESKDYEVFVQPKEGSMWTVGYDHLVDVAVKKGDKVKAGDVLGKPAIQGNGLHRFEIQINKDQSNTTTHYCPTSLLDPAVKEATLKWLGNMQAQWNTTAGLQLYDLSQQSPTGCLAKTMTPAQAEGR